MNRKSLGRILVGERWTTDIPVENGMCEEFTHPSKRAVLNASGGRIFHGRSNVCLQR